MAQAPILSGFADQAGTGPRTRVGAMDGKQGLQALSAMGTLKDVHVHRQAVFNAQSSLEGPLAVERRRRALAMGVTVATGRFC